MLTCESLLSRCPAKVQNSVPPALATNCRRPIGALTMGPLVVFYFTVTVMFISNG